VPMLAEGGGGPEGGDPLRSRQTNA
jgi:hypothetical protein